MGTWLSSLIWGVFSPPTSTLASAAAALAQRNNRLDLTVPCFKYSVIRLPQVTGANTMHNQKVSSYVVKHDCGFAPNPFGGVLTLATCKPVIRKSACVGDWVMGTGSSEGIGSGKLLFIAEVSKVVTLEEYGHSEEYAFKIPRKSDKGSRCGDNIYYKNEEGEWNQRENEFHKPHHQNQDIAGENVLVCEKFWYFGEAALEIPSQFVGLVKSGPGHKNNVGNPEVPAFLAWVRSHKTGIHGKPSSEIGSESCLPTRCTCVQAPSCLPS